MARRQRQAAASRRRSPGSADKPSAYIDGLQMLARRELSVEGVRARLRGPRASTPDDDRRGHRPPARDRRARRRAGSPRAYRADRGRRQGPRPAARRARAVEAARHRPRRRRSGASTRSSASIDERRSSTAALQKRLRGRDRLDATSASTRGSISYLMRPGLRARPRSSPALRKLAARVRGQRRESGVRPTLQ